MPGRDAEMLAMRLLLAFLSDDKNETAYLVWAILEESGCSQDEFQIAARPAREAASWWKSTGNVETGRRCLVAKLDRLMGIAA